MKEPKIKKDKLSNGWCIDWYGIRITLLPSWTEDVTEEYSSPAVFVEKVNKYSDESAVTFFIEGEE